MGTTHFSDLSFKSLSGAGAGAVRRGANTIEGGWKLRRFAAALAAATTSRVNIPFFGHSLVKGQYSDGILQELKANALAWRTTGMAAALSRTLNASVGGVVGYGIETFEPGGGATVFTQGGGAILVGNYTAGSPVGWQLALAAETHTCSFEARGASVRITGSSATVGLVPRYRINGGTITNAPAVASAPTPDAVSNYYEFTISGLTAGDVVQLLGAAHVGGVSPGTYSIATVDPDHKTVEGITVHRVAAPARGGIEMSAAFLDSTDPAPMSGWWGGNNNSRQRQLLASTAQLGATAGGAIVMTNINDIKMFADPAQGIAYGVTLADHARHMRNFIERQDALGNDTLIVVGPATTDNFQINNRIPYSQRDIIDAYKAEAAQSNCAAVLDLTGDWHGATDPERHAAQVASGFFTDTIHPDGQGSNYYGGRIGRALINAIGG